MDEEAYFAVIPAIVMYDERISMMERLLYGTITLLTKKDGYCYASNGYLASLYKCNESTITRHIGQLKKYGYLTVEIKDNYQRKIYVNLPKEGDMQNCIGGYSKLHRGVCKNEEGVMQNCIDNNISQYNELNKKSKNINNSKELFDRQGSVEQEKPKNNYAEIMEAWNLLPVTNIKAIKGTRLSMLKARLKDYTIDEVLSAISGIREQPFLLGQNNKGWQITFDWFVKPNNFIKVYEGNYKETQSKTHTWNDAQAGYEGAMKNLEVLIDE